MFRDPGERKIFIVEIILITIILFLFQPKKCREQVLVVDTKPPIDLFLNRNLKPLVVSMRKF